MIVPTISIYLILGMLFFVTGKELPDVDCEKMDVINDISFPEKETSDKDKDKKEQPFKITLTLDGKELPNNEMQMGKTFKIELTPNPSSDKFLRFVVIAKPIGNGLASLGTFTEVGPESKLKKCFDTDGSAVIRANIPEGDTGIDKATFSWTPPYRLQFFHLWIMCVMSDKQRHLIKTDFEITKSAAHDKVDDLYGDCYTKKLSGCVGLPSWDKCVEKYVKTAHDIKDGKTVDPGIMSLSCKIFLSWKQEDGKWIFHLLGHLHTPTNGYLAMGFSFDNSMNNDSVAACMYRSGYNKVNDKGEPDENGVAVPEMARMFTENNENAWRPDSERKVIEKVGGKEVVKSVPVFPDFKGTHLYGMKPIESKVIDGFLYCKFEQSEHELLNTPGRIVKLEAKSEYYLLMGKGLVEQTDSASFKKPWLIRHDDEMVSRKCKLGEFGVIEADASGADCTSISKIILGISVALALTVIIP